MPPSLPASRRVTGLLSLHSRGFGFINVEPEAGQPARSAFIPPPELNGLLADDRISAVLQQGQDGRLSASDVQLESRLRSYVVGEVYRRQGSFFVRLDSELSNTSLPLEAPAHKVHHGDFVLARLEERVERGPVLVWQRTVTQADERSWLNLLCRNALLEQLESASAVTQEVSQLELRAHTPTGRRDLRQVPTITVDAPSTQDIDDAISVLPADAEGSLRILVSIADVAAFVKPGSSLDALARAQATSVYLAGQVLPMLPHALSAQHLSLLPGVDRSCLTVEMRIDPEGQVRAVDVYESVIRSAARVSYTELAEFLQHHRVPLVLEPVRSMLPWLRAADARLLQARARRGGLEVSREETRILFDTQSGAPAGVEQVQPTPAHALIERFMVAANEAVAGWLNARGVPALYRVHAAPESSAVELLEVAAAHFGLAGGLGTRLTPLALAAFDRQVRGFPYEEAIRSVLLRSLGPATYTEVAQGHFGLAAPLYLHFTSPIRRYADLVVHRQIKAYLHGERRFDAAREGLERLAQHINLRNRLASRAENEYKRQLMARLMVARVGERFSARVTRVLELGLLVQLDETWVEGLLPVEALPLGPYQLVGADSGLEGPGGRYEPGMAVQVRLEEVDLEKGRLRFSGGERWIP